MDFDPKTYGLEFNIWIHVYEKYVSSSCLWVPTTSQEILGITIGTCNSIIGLGNNKTFFFVNQDISVKYRYFHRSLVSAKKSY